MERYTHFSCMIFLTHLEGACVVASNCGILSKDYYLWEKIAYFYHRWFFCVSNFTDFSSLHSQRAHKLNNLNVIGQMLTRTWPRVKWNQTENLASAAVTPDAGLVLPSPISPWHLWKKRHNQILPVSTFFSQYPQILRLQLFSAANVANQKPGLCREQYSHCSRQPGPPATLAEVQILLEEIIIPARQWYSPSPFSSDLGVWEIKPNDLTTEEHTKWKVNHTLLLVLCLSPNRPRVMAWLLFITEAQKASPLKLSLRLQAWMLEKGLSNRNQNTCSRRQGESMNSLTAPLLRPLPKVKLHFQKSLINLHILIEGLFYHSWTAA